MIATPSRVFLALLGAALLVPAVVAVAVRGDAVAYARTTHPASTASASAAKIRRQLRREARNGSPDKPVKVDPSVSASCSEPGTHEEEAVLPNARLFYRNWQGEEPAPGDATQNRATGCLYDTGRTTEFGFNNVIEGESFGMSKGAGDFVAFVTVLWEAADGSDDGFQVWDLRTGKRRFLDPGCETISDDCYIADIELSAKGSAAYSACLSRICKIYLVAAGATKRSLVGRVKYSGPSAVLLAEHHRLYWLSSSGKLKSRPFR